MDKTVVVIGSCNVDFVSYSSRLPVEGETLHGHTFVTTFGGKGANQAVAAAKLGSQTIMIARVGDDLWGDKYIENLNSFGVITDSIMKTAGVTTGVALINVADSGVNQIVIVGGANSLLQPEDVENSKDVISNANVLLCQLETPERVAIEAFKICKGVKVLNGAPAPEKFNPSLLTLSDIFCVNETEAATFSGLQVRDVKEGEAAIRKLNSMGARCVVLTMGAQGLIYNTAGEIRHIPSQDVPCVDSTGAGDAFLGALANQLVQCKSLDKCLETSNHLASISVTRKGTQKSFASAEEAGMLE